MRGNWPAPIEEKKERTPEKSEKEKGSEDESEESEKGSEDEIPSDPPQTDKRYFIAFDTLGSSNIFKDSLVLINSFLFFSFLK